MLWKIMEDFKKKRESEVTQEPMHHLAKKSAMHK